MEISLPVELLEQVIQTLSKREWRVLCATSRLLYLIARRNLYAHIDMWNQVPPDMNKHALFLARTLAERPELGRHVRTLTLHSMGVTPLDSGKLIPWTLHPILAHLSAFKHLQSLTIAGLCIDSDFCAKVQALKALRALSLVACSVASSVLEAFPRSKPRKNTLELSIIHPRSSEGWTAIAPSGLRSLSLNESELTPLPGSNVPTLETAILSQFALQGIHQSLTKLEWSQPIIPEEVIHLLERSPHIRVLSLCHPHQMHSRYVADLSPRAIPLLAEYSGPARYAGTFVPGRPVHSVTLGLGSRMGVDVLDVLRFSAVPVTSLALYAYQEDGFPFACAVESILQHAPATLRYLYWGRGIKKGEFGPRWRAAFARLPALRVFDTSGWGEYRDGSLRQDIVRAVSETSPSVREVIFRGNARSVRRGGGAWEEYII